MSRVSFFEKHNNFEKIIFTVRDIIIFLFSSHFHSMSLIPAPGEIKDTRVLRVNTHNIIGSSPCSPLHPFPHCTASKHEPSDKINYLIKNLYLRLCVHSGSVTVYRLRLGEGKSPL